MRARNPRRTITVALLGLTASLALTPAAMAMKADPVPKTAPSWAVRLLTAGDFAGLLSGSSGLYSVAAPTKGRQPAGTHIVRVDPASGHILARSSLIPAAALVGVSASKVLVFGATFALESPERIGAPELYELNPTTLRVESTERLPSNTLRVEGLGAWSLLITGKGWLMRWSISGHRPTWRWNDGGVANAFSAGGYVFDVVNTMGQHGGQLAQRSAATGKVTSRVIVPILAEAPTFSLTGDADTVFVAGGSPGDDGSIAAFRASPLRLVSSSWRNGDEIGGARGTPLPYFSEGPQVNLSDGTLWVTSAGLLACIAASSGDLGAIGLASEDSVEGPIVRADGMTYAVLASDSGQGSGLVRVVPPKGCGP